MRDALTPLLPTCLVPPSGSRACAAVLFCSLRIHIPSPHSHSFSTLFARSSRSRSGAHLLTWTNDITRTREPRRTCFIVLGFRFLLAACTASVLRGIPFQPRVLVLTMQANAHPSSTPSRVSSTRPNPNAHCNTPQARHTSALERAGLHKRERERLCVWLLRMRTLWANRSQRCRLALISVGWETYFVFLVECR